MRLALGLLPLVVLAACAQPPQRPSYEERYPDLRCREAASKALSTGACPGCFTRNASPDEIMDAAYKTCMTGALR
ncbi:MAG TPA: hypothetical protein VFV84_03565 [Burkholderiales bacterium]|nr:hypothetical protein [Burkholderiales bacterium]